VPQWAHQIFGGRVLVEHLSAGASAGSEHGAQEGGGLVYGGSRGAGFAERIEQHEVVDDAVVADSCDGDAGGAELGRVRFAPVAQRVSLVDA
jgi:hypothetical protein